MCMQTPQEVQKGTSLSQDGVLIKDGTEYHVGDDVYVHPDVFDAVDGSDTVENAIPDYAAKGRFHKVHMKSGSMLPLYLQCYGRLHEADQLHAPTALETALEDTVLDHTPKVQICSLKMQFGA